MIKYSWRSNKLQIILKTFKHSLIISKTNKLIWYLDRNIIVYIINIIIYCRLDKIDELVDEVENIELRVKKAEVMFNMKSEDELNN